MSNWNLYTYESGDVWVLDPRLIPRPNDDVEVSKASTQQAIQLADGSMGYIAPEVKGFRNEITFSWVLKDFDFRQQIEDYIDNHDYIKIETHIAGYEFIGRFKAITSKWLVGESPDQYVVSIIFERMEND